MWLSLSFSYLIVSLSVQGRVESCFSKVVGLRHGSDFTVALVFFLSSFIIVVSFKVAEWYEGCTLIFFFQMKSVYLRRGKFEKCVVLLYDTM